LDELPVLQRLEFLGRIAGEIADDPDDKRQLLLDDGPFGLDVVGDVNPRLAHSFQLFMHALAHESISRSAMEP
jgi:hypothetical protein